MRLKIINHNHGPLIIKNKKHIFPLWYCFLTDHSECYWLRTTNVLLLVNILHLAQAVLILAGSAVSESSVDTGPHACAQCWLLAGAQLGCQLEVLPEASA